MKKSEKILNFLAGKKDTLSPLLILTHNFPDPDAIASAYTLQYLTKYFYNIESKIVYGGIIGRMENRSMVEILDIPAYRLNSSDFNEYSNVALVDTQPSFQNNSFPENMKATIVIDQHKSTFKPKADLAVIDTKCGATCVILAEALISQNQEIPKNIATALAYGIISETLHLYRGTSKRVIKTYLSILPKCDITALAQIQNPMRSKNFFKTLGVGIQNAVVCSKLIASNLGSIESPDLVSQTADFLLTYKDIDWSLCTGRFKGTLYISLRSRQTEINAGNILREVIGDESRAGGHSGIAGGSIEIGKDENESKWHKAEMTILKKLTEKLDIKENECIIYPFRTIQENLEKESVKGVDN